MTPKYQYHIEEASPKDASLLTDIAWHSKKHWGYPDAWMAMWKADLCVSPDMISEHHVCKAIVNDVVAGFAIIVQLENGYEIEHCFIKPDFIGKGCGTTLLQHMLGQRAYQQSPFQVLADPNAVTFYEKFGFETVEQIPSKPEGRTLPLMRMVNG